MFFKFFVKLQPHLLSIICLFYVLLFLSYEVGYFLGPIYGLKFDLASIWNGFQTLSGAAFLAMVKYITDSVANTQKGEEPYREIVASVLNQMGEHIPIVKPLHPEDEPDKDPTV